MVIRKGPAYDTDSEKEGERTPQSVPKPKKIDGEGDPSDELEPGKPFFDRKLNPSRVFDDSELQVDIAPPPDPPPGPGRVLQKIHDRLRDKAELVKLHLKHDHMSTKNFEAHLCA